MRLEYGRLACPTLEEGEGETDAQSHYRPQRRWICIAGRACVALAAITSVFALCEVTGRAPSAAAAHFRSMLSAQFCKSFHSLDECMKYSAFEKYRQNIMAIISSPSPPKPLPFEDFLNANLDECTCKRAGTCARADNTIITMIVNLHRGRFDKNRNSFANYTEPLKRLIGRYPETPKVVFVQKGYGKEIAAAHPGGTNSPYLCLLEIGLEDLPEYAYRKDWAKTTISFFEKHMKLVWPQTLVPDYDILMASKFAVVGRAVKQNAFGSTTFAWVDGGLHPPMTLHLPAESALDIKSCGDKACLAFAIDPICRRHDFAREFKDNKAAIVWNCNGCQTGAIFTGTQLAMLNLARAFNRLAREYLDEGVVDCDQGLLLYLYLNQPNLVEFAHCTGGEWCPGFLLGAHNFRNASFYLKKDLACTRASSFYS